jgi:hypothetical protein
MTPDRDLVLFFLDESEGGSTDILSMTSSIVNLIEEVSSSVSLSEGIVDTVGNVVNGILDAIVSFFRGIASLAKKAIGVIANIFGAIFGTNGAIGQWNNGAFSNRSKKMPDKVVVQFTPFRKVWLAEKTYENTEEVVRSSITKRYLENSPEADVHLVDHIEKNWNSQVEHIDKQDEKKELSPEDIQKTVQRSAEMMKRMADFGNFVADTLEKFRISMRRVAGTDMTEEARQKALSAGNYAKLVLEKAGKLIGNIQSEVARSISLIHSSVIPALRYS